MSLTLAAPAKINLWLRVFAPDASGFHPLDTLFCAIDLADEIVVDTGGHTIELAVTGADLGALEDNLAVRAAHAFFRATRLPAAARIELVKRIPVGAGLGGGSSDAAGVLRALNRLHGEPLAAARLLEVGARLGSDVAFFLCGSPLAHGTGRGERLRPLPALPPRPVIVAMPAFAISTREAYRWLDEDRAYAPTSPAALDGVDWATVARRAQNDFEPVIGRRHPACSAIAAALRARGADIALLSGSGAAVFGIFDDAAASTRAAADLQRLLNGVSTTVATTLA